MNSVVFRENRAPRKCILAALFENDKQRLDIMLAIQKKSIESVINKETAAFQVNFYETHWEKILFLSSCLSLACTVAFAVLAYVLDSRMSVLVSWLSLVVTNLTVLSYKMMVSRGRRGFSSSPQREIFLARLMRYAAGFEFYHLEFAKGCYQLAAARLRKRVNALDRIFDRFGVIPLIVMGYWAFLNACHEGRCLAVKLLAADGQPVFNILWWLVVVFVVLYICVVRVNATAQWMEKASQLYEQAIRFKKAADFERLGWADAN